MTQLRRGVDHGESIGEHGLRRGLDVHDRLGNASNARLLVGLVYPRVIKRSLTRLAFDPPRYGPVRKCGLQLVEQTCGSGGRISNS